MDRLLQRTEGRLDVIIRPPLSWEVSGEFRQTALLPALGLSRVALAGAGPRAVLHPTLFSARRGHTLSGHVGKSIFKVIVMVNWASGRSTVPADSHRAAHRRATRFLAGSGSSGKGCRHWELGVGLGVWVPCPAWLSRQRARLKRPGALAERSFWPDSRPAPGHRGQHGQPTWPSTEFVGGRSPNGTG